MELDKDNGTFIGAECIARIVDWFIVGVDRKAYGVRRKRTFVGHCVSIGRGGSVIRTGMRRVERSVNLDTYPASALTAYRSASRGCRKSAETVPSSPAYSLFGGFDRLPGH